MERHIGIEADRYQAVKQKTNPILEDGIGVYGKIDHCIMKTVSKHIATDNPEGKASGYRNKGGIYDGSGDCKQGKQ